MSHPLTKVALAKPGDPRTALLQSYLGQALLVARLKRKLKDREERLKFIAARVCRSEITPYTKELLQLAADLPTRNWRRS